MFRAAEPFGRGRGVLFVAAEEALAATADALRCGSGPAGRVRGGRVMVFVSVLAEQHVCCSGDVGLFWRGGQQ